MPDLPQFKGNTTADAVVIGAGFTGLSTALHLAEQGADVIVLEAAYPGWGASGRNNGQVIPTLTRAEPDHIVAQFGEVGERFVALLRDSAATLYDMVRQYELEAEAEQNGWIQPVHSPGRMKIAEARVEQWSRYGAPVELLSRQDVLDRTGSEQWYGGFWNCTGGHINPLALARELARAARARGAKIFVETAATSFVYANNQWRVETEGGLVTAPALMLATNAYTGEFVKNLRRDVAQEVVPILSWQMATSSLGDNIRAHIIPGREAVSDTHGDLHFMRYDARNRLVTGGALVFSAGGEKRLRHRIANRLSKLFPAIGNVSFDFVWSGYVGMTSDFMPRFHQLGPNGFAWVGCNGRGVALSVALGREFARALRGQSLNELGLPLSSVAPLPLHPIVRQLAPLRLVQLRWRDRREIE